MQFSEIKARDDQYVLHTYARFPVDIERGKNATLWSAEGKEYIDFTSGIGVSSVGTANPKWVDAVAVQAAKLGHMSNLFYTQPCRPPSSQTPGLNPTRALSSWPESGPLTSTGRGGGPSSP